jgi:hypothetical protein
MESIVCQHRDILGNPMGKPEHHKAQTTKAHLALIKLTQKIWGTTMGKIQK